MKILDATFKNKYIGLKIAGMGLAFALIGLLIYLGVSKSVGWWFVIAGFWFGFVPGAAIHAIMTIITVTQKITRLKFR